MLTWVNAGNRPSWAERVEKHWQDKTGGDCRFLAFLTVRERDQKWSQLAPAIFWQEKPEQAEYSNYFGLYDAGGQTMICNGLSAVTEPMLAVISQSGEVLFSRFRHDYRESLDKTCYIDGGRDYVRRGGLGLLGQVRIIGHKFEVFQWENHAEYEERRGWENGLGLIPNP